MATKSKGVGRGGARPGAGRKPKPPIDFDAARAMFAGKTVEELMELATLAAAFQGHWDEVSKRGARYINAAARQTKAASGKRAQRQDAAERASTGRFAPPPPPGSRPN